MNESCNHCRFGRRDGKPCNATACLCKCHRVGVSEIVKIDRAIAEFEQAKRRGKRSSLDIAFAVDIPLSFDEECGRKKPELVKSN